MSFALQENTAVEMFTMAVGQVQLSHPSPDENDALGKADVIGSVGGK